MPGIYPEIGVPHGSSQASNTVDATTVAGCAELFYANKCTPRFNPAQANAMISEILNAVNCGGNTYDCGRLDNLCLSIRDIAKDVLHDCQDRVYPSASGSCVIERLVLSTDAAGCARIARYSEASAALGVAIDNSVYGNSFPSVLRPVTPLNPATYYTLSDLSADVISGTVDGTKLAPNKLVTLNITVPCNGTTVEFISNSFVNFAPTYNGGNGGSSLLAYSIDDVFPTSGGIALSAGYFTNYQNSFDASFVQVLNAGVHKIDVYLIATSAGLPPAQVYVTGHPTISTNRLLTRIALS